METLHCLHLAGGAGIGVREERNQLILDRPWMRLLSSPDTLNLVRKTPKQEPTPQAVETAATPPPRVKPSLQLDTDKHLLNTLKQSPRRTTTMPSIGTLPKAARSLRPRFGGTIGTISEIFHKFSNKVDIWKLQAAAYAPAKELALILYTSLSGECEQELEHLPVESFYHAKGIDYLMQQLKGPMELKEVPTGAGGWREA